MTKAFRKLPPLSLALAVGLAALDACSAGRGFKASQLVPKPPPSFVATIDGQQQIRSIDVRDGMSKDQVWQIVTDAREGGFKLDVKDRASEAR